MATLLNPHSKPFTPTTSATISSEPKDEVKAGFDSSWIKSASSSRRSSLAAPPGISLPVQNSNPKMMPKLTRAASVSFLPQLSDDSFNLNHLTQLAEATSRIQNGKSIQPKMNSDFWNQEDKSNATSWNGSNDNSMKSQFDFNSYQKFTFQTRRMSLNPASDLLPNRTMGYTNPLHGLRSNGYNNYDMDPSLSLPFGNSNYLSYSRSDSLSSSSLATQSLGSTDSITSQASSRVSRRFSLAPQFGIDLDFEDQLSQQLDNLWIENSAPLSGRRHSVAASAFPIRHQSPPTPSEHNDPISKTYALPKENIPEYTETYKIDNMNTNINSKEGENYFVVEFKHDRMDAYYMPLDSMTTYKVGDLVIVEADRGQDLGKIVKDRVNMMQLQQIQAEHRMKMADTPRQFEPKRILRHAHPAEVSQLVTKAQDEAKALQMCHVKLRHHNLPMEIVDAEYQWDRRKLTFFYRAEERIDFRELVRELFKVYKTRIWMRALLA